MGYQNNPLAGYKMATPTFGTIGAEKYPIDNFVVKGSVDAQTNIQVLNSEGQLAGRYYWYNDGGPGYPAGWFDALGNVPANIELDPGDAVFFFTQENGVTTESSGEVMGDKTTSIVGYKMVGNCSPVKIDIDQLTVKGSVDAQTNIQVLNSEGQLSGRYYWYNDGGPGYPAGWFDALGNVPAGIDLNPGDAVFFFTQETGVTATIPGAIK